MYRISKLLNVSTPHIQRVNDRGKMGTSYISKKRSCDINVWNLRFPSKQRHFPSYEAHSQKWSRLVLNDWLLLLQSDGRQIFPQHDGTKFASLYLLLQRRYMPQKGRSLVVLCQSWRGSVSFGDLGGREIQEFRRKLDFKFDGVGERYSSQKWLAWAIETTIIVRGKEIPSQEKRE